jgi:hypothetical protein
MPADPRGTLGLLGLMICLYLLLLCCLLLTRLCPRPSVRVTPAAGREQGTTTSPTTTALPTAAPPAARSSAPTSMLWPTLASSSFTTVSRGSRRSHPAARP